MIGVIAVTVVFLALCHSAYWLSQYGCQVTGGDYVCLFSQKISPSWIPTRGRMDPTGLEPRLHHGPRRDLGIVVWTGTRTASM